MAKVIHKEKLSAPRVDIVLLHQKERLCYTILGNVQIDVGEEDEKYAE